MVPFQEMGTPTAMARVQNRQARRLSDLSDEDDRPLTTHELAQMIGMSSTFVRTEIRSGHLRAIRVGHGRKRVFRIPVHEAKLYLGKLGLV